MSTVICICDVQVHKYCIIEVVAIFPPFSNGNLIINLTDLQEQEAQQREELLSRRFTTNVSNHCSPLLLILSGCVGSSKS